MRVVLVSAAMGGVFGAAAALYVTNLQAPRGPARPMASAVVALPSTIPPGWDRQFLSSQIWGLDSRVTALENQAPPAQSAAPEPAARDTSDPVATRAAEIEEQYRNDLEIQDQKLRDHDEERVDGSWARAQAETITSAFNAAVDVEHPLRVGRVDCRTATCVTELVYPSPDDALLDRGALMRAHIQGCHGMSSALTPPTGPGPYTTTVIYNCR